MKEAYTQPELEIIRFTTEDVITTSGIGITKDPDETPIIK